MSPSKLGIVLALLVAMRALAQNSGPPAETSHSTVVGVTVESVGRNSEAAKAGVLAGDVLRTWSRGSSHGIFNSPFDLPYIEVAQASLGSVRIQGLRNGKPQSWLLGDNNWGIRARPTLTDSFLSSYVQGQTAAQRGNGAEAIRIWQSLASIEKPDDLSVALWLYTRIAEHFVQMQQWDKAGDTYRTALGAAQAAGPEVKAELFRQWARVLESRDDLVSAEKYYRDMQAERQKLAAESMAVASAVRYVGTINLKQGNFSAAENFFHRALELEQTLAPQSMAAARTFQSYGVLLQESGKLAKAEYYYRRALAIIVGAYPRTYNHEIALINLGTLKYQRGDPVSAENYFRRALSIAQALQPESVDVAKIINDLSYCLLARHQFAKADQYAARALAIRQRKAPGSLLVVFSLLDLGRISEARRDLKKAEEFYRQALAIAESLPPPHPELATVLNALAGILSEQGSLAEAETYCRRALSLLQQMAPEGASHAEALALLASISRREHQEPQAAQFYSQAVAEFERLVSDLGGAEEDVIRYRAQLQGFYKEYLALLVAHGEVDRAFRISEASRARALAEMLRAAHFDIRSGVDPKLLDLERSLRLEIRAKSERRLHLLVEQKEAEAKQIEQELRSLIARHQEIEGQIRSSSPGYLALTQPKALEAKEVQSLLDPDTVLLEYSIGPEHSYVWLVSQSSLKIFELPKSAQVQGVARRLYRNLTARTRPTQGDPKLEAANWAKADAVSHTLAAGLSRMLLRPTANEIKHKRLLIVSDGALHYVPFASLPSPEKPAVPLVVEHEIVSLPSASVLAEIRQANQGRPMSQKEVAVLADPVFAQNDVRVVEGAGRNPSQAGLTTTRNVKDEQFSQANAAADSAALLTRSAADFGLLRRGAPYLPRLPFSRREAKAILSVTPKGQGMAALDFQASRATAVSPDLSQYRVLHFATHALLNSEHPELSGLVFSLVDPQGRPQSGFLGLEDVYNMNLSADLVVLSACETALGREVQGEGLIGLTRGFMYAGASQVVASLWSVDDEATAELMRLFYKSMEQDGLRPAAALRRAQMQVRMQQRWSQPYYWAGFVIQGEW
ncbi:MAG TPA: CHAT domain-containing protein [Candidatus Angelobacter sp.]